MYRTFIQKVSFGWLESWILDFRPVLKCQNLISQRGLPIGCILFENGYLHMITAKRIDPRGFTAKIKFGSLELLFTEKGLTDFWRKLMWGSVD